MDFSNPLGIKYRVVSDSQVEGEPARIVSGSRTYATDCKDLWDAVTNIERLQHWFNPISGDLKLGGRFQLEGNAGGQIKQCDPPNALEVTWECGGNMSWVKVHLKPEGDATRLTLEHIMLKDEASEAHWKKYGPGATGVGWDLGFLVLGPYLESGETVDLDENNKWMTTEAGKVFIRDCSKAWGDAHIAQGEDSDVAVAMAEETAKAYTGE